MSNAVTNDKVNLGEAAPPKHADWHVRIERAKAVRDATRELQKDRPVVAPASKPRLWSN